ERGEPQIIHDLSAYTGAKFSGLSRSCRDCAVIVVPLLDSGPAVGALVLLRTPDRAPFRADEVARARTFGELASLAFRKVFLLEDSERRREELERITESRAGLMRGFSHDPEEPARRGGRVSPAPGGRRRRRPHVRPVAERRAEPPLDPRRART